MDDAGPGGRLRLYSSAAAGGAGEGSGLVGSVLVLGIEAVAGFRRHEPALLFAPDAVYGAVASGGAVVSSAPRGDPTLAGLREPAAGRAAVACSGWWRAAGLAQVRGDDATLHRGRPAAVGRAVGRQLEVERLDETVCERCSLRRVVKCGRLGWSASPGRLHTRRLRRRCPPGRRPGAVASIASSGHFSSPVGRLAGRVVLARW